MNNSKENKCYIAHYVKTKAKIFWKRSSTQKVSRTNLRAYIYTTAWNKYTSNPGSRKCCVACWENVKYQWCKIAGVYITTQNSLRNMTNFIVKTICKVLRNCEGLNENNLCIAFNALMGLFCFGFVLFLLVVLSFLFLVLLRCQF